MRSTTDKAKLYSPEIELATIGVLLAEPESVHERVSRLNGDDFHEFIYLEVFRTSLIQGSRIARSSGRASSFQTMGFPTARACSSSYRRAIPTRSNGNSLLTFWPARREKATPRRLMTTSPHCETAGPAATGAHGL